MFKSYADISSNPIFRLGGRRALGHDRHTLAVVASLEAYVATPREIFRGEKWIFCEQPN